MAWLKRGGLVVSYLCTGRQVVAKEKAKEVQNWLKARSLRMRSER